MKLEQQKLERNNGRTYGGCIVTSTILRTFETDKDDNNIIQKYSNYVSFVVYSTLQHKRYISNEVMLAHLDRIRCEAPVDSQKPSWV